MQIKPESEKTHSLRRLLDKRILILDGAMGTMIQAYKFEEADYRGARFQDFAQDLKGNNDLLSLVFCLQRSLTTKTSKIIWKSRDRAIKMMIMI